MPRTLIALFSLAAVVAAVVALSVWPHDAAGGTGNPITVDTNLNNDTNDGLCSLREAITAANTNAPYNGCGAGSGSGRDHISFVLGAQVRTISIVTPLPTITEFVVIDGGDPKVELRGPGGILVSGENGITIASTAPNTQIRNLVINSFRDDGILTSADNVLLAGNYIGTNFEGTDPLPNLGFGIQVHGVGATIGGSKSSGTACTGDCNLISGNIKDGILLDNDSSSAEIMGNFIGTDITGMVDMVPGSVTAGIDVKGNFHSIGYGLAVVPGQCVGGCNLISGNLVGIRVFAGADTTGIGSNYIGPDITGTIAIAPGYGTGVRNAGHHTFVGGDPSTPGNLISGMQIGILAEADLMFIEHNLIGTDLFGTEAVPNELYGIEVHGGQNTIIQNGNLISGNFIGVWIEDSGGVAIRDNHIGLSADGQHSILNHFSGVYIVGASTLNSVGETGHPNEIAFNGDAGITVDGAAALRNIIGENSIHDNSGPGIDNKNGGNAELLPPVITTADLTSASGTSCASCLIQVFSDNDDEGRKYEGQTTADGAGAWTFSSAFTGPNLTATAMDNTTFNTSEFSQPYEIIEPTPTPTPGPEFIQGDILCDQDVGPDDFDFLLHYAAGLNFGVTPGADCPDIGQLGPDAITIFPWGDVNCDSAVNAVDALFVLVYIAGANPLTPVAPACTPIGQVIFFGPPG